MKFATLASSILSLAGVALAVPNPTQTASIGYATLNGGTSGGKGGSTTTVSSLSALTTAVADDTARIVYVTGTISGNTVIKVGSNKSVLGISGATLSGVGLRVLEKSNVIIRNLKISKVLADAGDHIGIQGTTVTNVWVDHVDLSSDQDHDKDYYDGLLDITHGVQYASVTWSYFHDHWKGSLVGHSDSNEDEDVNLKVTYAYNYWKNINSRMPSFRFGTGHIFNSCFEDSADGINTRVGARLLVESSYAATVDDAIFDDGGCATVVDFVGTNTAPACSPVVSYSGVYSYSLLGSGNVCSTVKASVGTTL